MVRMCGGNSLSESTGLSAKGLSGGPRARMKRGETRAEVQKRIEGKRIEGQTRSKETCVETIRRRLRRVDWGIVLAFLGIIAMMLGRLT